MKIIIVGATGTIGQKLYKELSPRHEVIKASQNKGDVKVDITSLASIEQMYTQVGKFDALEVAAGGGYMGPFHQTTEEHITREYAVK